MDWAAVTEALLAAGDGSGEAGSRLDGPLREAFEDLLVYAEVIKGFVEYPPPEGGTSCD